jgi:hypothetical protein
MGFGRRLMATVTTLQPSSDWIRRPGCQPGASLRAVTRTRMSPGISPRKVGRRACEHARTLGTINVRIRERAGLRNTAMCSKVKARSEALP